MVGREGKGREGLWRLHKRYTVNHLKREGGVTFLTKRFFWGGMTIFSCFFLSLPPPSHPLPPPHLRIHPFAMNWKAFFVAMAVVTTAVYLNDDTATGPQQVRAYFRENFPEVMEQLNTLFSNGETGYAFAGTSPNGTRIKRVTYTEVAFLNYTKGSTYPRLDADDRENPTFLWSADELKHRNGTNVNRELLLSIGGEVYDVGTGAEYYAPGKGYAGMSGVDVSCGFATGVYEEEKAGMADLTNQQVKTVLDWRKFYREHETYRFVGLLEGNYWTAGMEQTDHLKDVNARYAVEEKKVKDRANLGKIFLSCNSKFEQGNPDIKLWCDDSYHNKVCLPLMISFLFFFGQCLRPAFSLSTSLFFL